MKITGKMILHWSIAMVLVLIVGFGAVTITLAAMPVRYGHPMGETIKAEHLSEIRYTRQDGGKQILTGVSRKSFDDAVDEILEYINNAGKTNKLKQLFQASGEETITANNTPSTTVSGFQNRHTQYLEISFKKSSPQYGIKDVDNVYSFVPASEVTARNSTVWILFIPLDNIENKFMQHTWFIVSYDPMENNKLNLSITRKFTTYGNYYKLANYISELNVR